MQLEWSGNFDELDKTPNNRSISLEFNFRFCIPAASEHEAYWPKSAAIPREKRSHGINRWSGILTDPMTTQHSLPWWRLLWLQRSQVLYIIWCLLIGRGQRKTFYSGCQPLCAFFFSFLVNALRSHPWYKSLLLTRHSPSVYQFPVYSSISSSHLRDLLASVYKFQNFKICITFIEDAEPFLLSHKLAFHLFRFLSLISSLTWMFSHHQRVL